MSMNVGANYEQLQRLNTQFTTEAGAVQDLQRRLNTLVSSTVGSTWQGQAANQFQQLWSNEYTQALTRLSDALNQAAQEVAGRMRALQDADRI